MYGASHFKWIYGNYYFAEFSKTQHTFAEYLSSFKFQTIGEQSEDERMIGKSFIQQSCHDNELNTGTKCGNNIIHHVIFFVYNSPVKFSERVSNKVRSVIVHLSCSTTSNPL